MAENKPFDICERTFVFANRVLDITSALPSGKEPGVARDQLSRSGPAVGSNTEEAMGAISKIEKRKYLGIARRECRESRYWLRIINHRWCPVQPDVEEATEIRNILSAMIRNLDDAA